MSRRASNDRLVLNFATLVPLSQLRNCLFALSIEREPTYYVPIDINHLGRIDATEPPMGIIQSYLNKKSRLSQRISEKFNYFIYRYPLKVLQLFGYFLVTF